MSKDRGTCFILDSLYNSHPDTARTDEDRRYARGVMVGLISAFMAEKMQFADPFREAISKLAGICNVDGTRRPVVAECVPETWRADFLAAGIVLE